jgi:hypothetical protein
MELGSIGYLQTLPDKDGDGDNRQEGAVEYVALSLSLSRLSYIIGITAIQDQAEKGPCPCNWILQRPHQRDRLAEWPSRIQAAAFTRIALTTLPTSTPYVKTFEVDLENLRPGVSQDLTVLEEVWRLLTDDSVQTRHPG